MESQYGTSVLVSLMSPRIMSWLLDFWKICTPLCWNNVCVWCNKETQRPSKNIHNFWTTGDKHKCTDSWYPWQGCSLPTSQAKNCRPDDIGTLCYRIRTERTEVVRNLAGLIYKQKAVRKHNSRIGVLLNSEPHREGCRVTEVGSSWNVMAHDDAREGKWRGQTGECSV